MDEKRRQEIMHRMAEGMRAVSNEEMARRQLAACDGMRQRGPMTSGEQDAARNFCAETNGENKKHTHEAQNPSYLKKVLTKIKNVW